MKVQTAGVHSLPPRLGASVPDAPAHLAKVEASMWRQLVGHYEFAPGELDLLRTALEAHQRARSCREIISKEGLQIRDRFNAAKAHPLCIVEHANRSAFVAVMKLLRLDVPQDKSR